MLHFFILKSFIFYLFKRSNSSIDKLTTEINLVILFMASTIFFVCSDLSLFLSRCNSNKSLVAFLFYTLHSLNSLISKSLVFSAAEILSMVNAAALFVAFAPIGQASFLPGCLLVRLFWGSFDLFSTSVRERLNFGIVLNIKLFYKNVRTEYIK